MCLCIKNGIKTINLQISNFYFFDRKILLSLFLKVDKPASSLSQQGSMAACKEAQRYLEVLWTKGKVRYLVTQLRIQDQKCPKQP